jgi:hypothetical protein
MSYLNEVFLTRREGKFVLLVSLFYLSLFCVLKALSASGQATGFYTWMCGFMPVAMLIFYFEIGGFKRRFKSSMFNMAILVLVSLLPAFMKLADQVRY